MEVDDEIRLVITGIGGQGIQLMGKTLALAATLADRHAMLAADYGGEMRGGPSQASVVIGSRPLRALPILPCADVALVMHDKFGGAVPDRLDPGGCLVVNSSIVDVDGIDRDVTAVAATRIAREIGAPQAAGFVLLGAYNRLAGVVDPERLLDAMTSLLPPYRVQHAAANATALAAGAEAVVAGATVAR